MSVSTDGQICFGIKFGEEFEFPWNAEKYDEDIGEWWMDVNGYKPPFEMFDENGKWIGGEIAWPEYKQEEYYNARYKFEKKHPLPIELVNYCSGEYPAYILAVPKSCLTASRGYPQSIDKLFAIEDEAPEWEDQLKAFCKKYGIRARSAPKWWLSSYWG